MKKILSLLCGLLLLSTIAHAQSADYIASHYPWVATYSQSQSATATVNASTSAVFSVEFATWPGVGQNQNSFNATFCNGNDISYAAADNSINSVSQCNFVTEVITAGQYINSSTAGNGVWYGTFQVGSVAAQKIVVCKAFGQDGNGANSLCNSTNSNNFTTFTNQSAGVALISINNVGPTPLKAGQILMPRQISICYGDNNASLGTTFLYLQHANLKLVGPNRGTVGILATWDNTPEPSGSTAGSLGVVGSNMLSSIVTCKNVPATDFYPIYVDSDYPGYQGTVGSLGGGLQGLAVGIESNSYFQNKDTVAHNVTITITATADVYKGSRLQ